MTSTDYLLVSAGDARYAIHAAQVLAVHDDVPVERVPGTLAWFLGLAVLDGRLLPATDLDAFMRDVHSDSAAPAHSVVRCLLQLPERLANTALAVDSVHAAVDGKPAAADSQAVLSPEGERWQLLDLGELVRSRRFLSIGEALA